VGATWPELFEARVSATPDAVALVFEGTALTYAELNARANRLAHALVARGAGPERVVGLSLPRSVEMIVAEVAVLKAGGAYLPLDPDYPAERIAFMVADAAPVVVLDDVLEIEALSAGHVRQERCQVGNDLRGPALLRFRGRVLTDAFSSCI
jgi:non-ribosomal peptide synthetase component F